jgi:integrase
MGLFKRTDSPFWWMLLEGTGRKKENTRIRHDGSSATLRKQQEAQAEEIYHARMTQLAKGRVGLPIASAETFKTWSTWYEKHHTNKHRGKLRELVMLEHLRDHFNAYRLSDIRPARWKEYETARLKAVAINTVGRELALMKSILTAAVGEHLEVSPLVHVKRKTERLPAKRTLSADDCTRLLEQLHDQELHDLFVVGLGTLLRQETLVNLRRQHHQGSRLVVQTKTGPHQIALEGPTELQTAAAEVLVARMPKGNGYFFPTWRARFSKPDPKQHARGYLAKIFSRACKRAGIPWGLRAGGVVWHTATRASGATRMLREFGIDIRTVQLLGPWRSLDQMAEYLGLDLGAPKGKGG